MQIPVNYCWLLHLINRSTNPSAVCSFLLDFVAIFAIICCTYFWLCIGDRGYDPSVLYTLCLIIIIVMIMGHVFSNHWTR